MLNKVPITDADMYPKGLGYCSNGLVSRAQSVCDKENIQEAFKMRKKHKPTSKEYKQLTKFISMLVKERRRDARVGRFTL